MKQKCINKRNELLKEYEKLEKELEIEEGKDIINEERMEELEDSIDAIEIVIEILDTLIYESHKSKRVGKELETILKDIF